MERIKSWDELKKNDKILIKIINKDNDDELYIGNIEKEATKKNGAIISYYEIGEDSNSGTNSFSIKWFTICRAAKGIYMMFKLDEREWDKYKMKWTVSLL